MTLILDGKALAQTRELELAERVKALYHRTAVRPRLATLLVGDDPATATYVRMKGNACRRVGMESDRLHLPATTTTDALLQQIAALNEDPNIHGILLQHPMPEQIDERRCFDAIDRTKDVDGVGCLGFGLMSMGAAAFGSATPSGIMKLLRHHEIACSGLHAVVVGRSPILGKPMAAMLLNDNCTVTVCHSRTRDLPLIIRGADLIVGAVGIPEFIRAEWITDGAVVIDAGYHPNHVGDIELAPLQGRARALTPVPGGVGPMTISTLIEQTLEAAEAIAA